MFDKLGLILGVKKDKNKKKVERNNSFNPAYQQLDDINNSDVEKEIHLGETYDEFVKSEPGKKQYPNIKSNENKDNVIVLNQLSNNRKETIDVRKLFIKGVKNYVEKEYKQAVSNWLQIEKIYSNIKNQNVDRKEYLGRSLYNLGLCYEQGKGVEQDLEKACTYYQKAVYLGNVKAYCNLGYLYMKNPNKESEGIKYFQIAAEKGDIIALYNLGCYYYGKKNKEKFIEYFKKAARGGNEDAKAILQKLSD